MKKWMSVIRQITLLSQFGLSFITPILLCLALCWFLNSRVGLGVWVYIPGFFFGFGGSFMVAWKFYLSVTKSGNKEKKETKVSYNEHF